jgi:hypothetical protein
MIVPGFVQPLLRGLPAERRAWLRRLVQPAYLGALRRTQPLSQRYGFDRGQPVDRYYIEAFLAAHRSDVRGRGLEVKTAAYLHRYNSGLNGYDVLDIDARNPEATVITDLSAAENVPDDQYDCFVLTQTLQFIYDWRAALEHARRMLRPGGVLLVTVPTVSRIDRTLANIDFWRFTPLACQRAFGEIFGEENVSVETFGNVLTSSAFLMGLAAEDLRQDELERNDPLFPVLVGIRAQRP